VSAPRPSRIRRAVPLPREWVPPPMPTLRALCAAVVPQVFDDLGISVAVWLYDQWWQAIHVHTPSLTALESEIGVDLPRYDYNQRCIARALSTRRPVIGAFRGFSDLFYPLVSGNECKGIVVAGPFARARPSSAEIRARWVTMTGSPGRPGDPSFYRYVSLSLSVLTLEGSLFDSFRGLMTCFARLVCDKSDPGTLGKDLQRRRHELLAARLPDLMWKRTRRVIDEQASGRASVIDHGLLAGLGVDRVPQGVVVGLLTSGRRVHDPMDERVRADAFLRACVALAARRGGFLVGPVGNNGVVLLVESARALADLTSRVAALARKFGFAMHAGLATPQTSETLPARYVTALRAAEQAASEGRPFVRGEPAVRPASAARLWRLRAELGRSAARSADGMAARFEEYVEAVLAATGYRLELVRGHLDAGFERLFEPIAEGGLIDERGVDELWASVRKSADAARSVADLTEAYRRNVADLARGLLGSTTEARHDRSLKRAHAFLHEHLSEPLPLERVARAAGFAPKYFAALFRKSEGIAYTTYLRDFRLARAKEMLKNSRLSVERVGRACGFSSRTHFHRVFLESCDMTPTHYRLRR
jgi:AraC-like DNA-binding protein